MSRSITVGVPDTENPTFHTSEGANPGAVKIGGHASNQVQVTNRMDGKSMDGRPAEGSNDPAPPSGDTVETTHGTAKVHRTMTGETLIRVPGGVEMRWSEAVVAGLIKDGGREQAPAKSDNRAGNNKASGDGDGDGTDADTELPTVDRAELDSHIAEINAVGDALTAAGIDAEDALARSVESARATGELPDDVSEALIARFGDDADAVADNVNYHVAALTIDAMRDMGLSLTPEVAAAYDKFVSDRSDMVSATVAAIRGQPAMLRQIVTEFAASRRR